MSADAPATTLEGTGHRAVRVGVVGGGQLGRMMLPPAARLGLELVVLAEAGAPAVAAGALLVEGEPSDLRALVRLAGSSDVLTFEHEHVDPRVLAALEAQGMTVRPGPQAFVFAHDKLALRRMLAQAGLPQPAWAPVTSLEDVERFAADGRGWPLVLKAARGGYDGRGVWVCASADEAREVVDEAAAREVALLVEAHARPVVELACLVARAPSGVAETWPVVETVQADGMCREVVLPARVASDVAARAAQVGRAVAQACGATGVCAVELFVTADDEVLVNEIALRPHNSGHLTIEACATSQFEQHLRSVLDLPLGSSEAVVEAAAMVNVVGPPDGSDPRDRLAEALAVRGAAVHLYGKDARPGRKLGHVTATAGAVDEALRVARDAAAALEGRPA